MKPGFIILTALILIVAACKSQKPAAKVSSVHYMYLAQSEDTAWTYTFGLLKDYRFIYMATSKEDHPKRVRNYYSGRSVLSEDTIYLQFNRNKSPNNFEKFLLREVSGNYLIQNYAHNAGRIYLRIYHNNYR